MCLLHCTKPPATSSFPFGSSPFRRQNYRGYASSAASGKSVFGALSRFRVILAAERLRQALPQSKRLYGWNNGYLLKLFLPELLRSLGLFDVTLLSASC